MKSTLKKITATTLAVLTVMFTLCLTSFAMEEKGGALVYNGSSVTHYDEIEDAWNAAAAIEKPVKVKLMEDWTADEDGSFGKGKGFYKGAIAVSTRFCNLELDLNGYTVDRGLTSEKSNGCVFYINNSFVVTITDSSESGTSVITGGFNKGNGGAFSVQGSQLIVSNVTVKGNKTSSRGGAFWIDIIAFDSEDVTSRVTLDNCIVTENKAKTGGAIYIETSNRIRIFDTTVTNNFAAADGGIHTEVCGLITSFVTLGGKVIIADNKTESDGTGLMLDEGVFRKVYVEYSSSRPLDKDSKIVVLSKTGDKTLRITDNSDSSNIDCFEYENDSYRIVEKTSGSSVYLDIKKN